MNWPSVVVVLITGVSTLVASLGGQWLKDSVTRKEADQEAGRAERAARRDAYLALLLVISHIYGTGLGTPGGSGAGAPSMTVDPDLVDAFLDHRVVAEAYAPADTWRQMRPLVDAATAAVNAPVLALTDDHDRLRAQYLEAMRLELGA